VDLTGKGPVIDRSVAWAREPTSGEHRTVERQRVRRRTRPKSEMRAKIRRRVVLACVGALLFMAIGIYFALGRGEGASGDRPPTSPSARALALAASPSALGGLSV
jgi:cytochrome c-type biogenesis protein CcmH/NrfG